MGVSTGPLGPRISVLDTACVCAFQDVQSFVQQRLAKLLGAGVVSALVCMVKLESPALTDACRECISRSGCRQRAVSSLPLSLALSVTLRLSLQGILGCG